MWHLGLLSKLAEVCIKGNVLKRTREYLNNRKIQVYLEGTFTEEKMIGVLYRQALYSLLYYSMLCYQIFLTIRECRGQILRMILSLCAQKIICLMC